MFDRPAFDPALAHVWLLSFGDSRLKRPLRRMRRQARQFGFRPEQTCLWTEHNLNSDFCEKMKRRLVRGSRGFGYWCWKPQVVLQTLNLMPENDILLYADVGCHLNPNGKARFQHYLDALGASDLVVFQSQCAYEENWAKGDVLDFFHVRGNTAITRSGQIAGGIFLVRNTPSTKGFFEDLRRHGMNDFRLLDDTPSMSPNCAGFREHRHDQSLFSIMCKLAGYDIHSFPVDDFSPLSPHAPAMPVLAKRDIAFGWRSHIPPSIKKFILRCRWLSELNDRMVWKKRL